jgi:serine/threonine-protein kinase
MLSGKRMFEGESLSDTLASILRDEIPWSRLPAGTPEPIRGLLRRCLERDPAMRLQAIGEARILIDAAAAGGRHAPPIAGSAAGGRWRRVAPWLLASMAVVTAAAALWTRPSPAPVETPLRKFWIAADLGDATDRRPFTIAPDGARIAYVAENRLWVRDLTALDPRLLIVLEANASSQTSVSPFWSPDAGQIAYADEGKIWKIPAEGGTPIAVCNAPAGFAGGCWTEDDRIVFSVPRGDLFQVSSRGGDPSVLLARHLPDDVDFHDPWVLPQGKGLVYALHRKEGVDTIELLADGRRKMLLRVEGQDRATPQVVNMVCYDQGHLVYRRDQGNEGVWAVPFSLASLEVTGEPFLIAAHGRDPSVGANGVLVYRPGQEDVAAHLVWTDDQGAVEDTIGEAARGLQGPALSPDGTRLAYVAEENGAGEIWVHDLVRDTRSRLTFTPDEEFGPVWIPGRDWVAFSSPRENDSRILAKSADGSGTTRVLAEHAVSPTFTPDGRTMIYQSSGDDAGALLRVEWESGSPPDTVMRGTSSNLYSPSLSWDGRYLSYLSWERGTATTYIRPFSTAEGRWELPGSWESQIEWRPDRIYYTSDRPEPALYVIPTVTTPVLSLGTPRRLFTLETHGLFRYNGFDVAADGRRFVLVQSVDTEARRGIVVVENWLGEFNRAR